MAISSSDIKFYRSSASGSEGGTVSATEIVTAVQNNLWPNVSDASRVAGGSDITKWFMTNEHPTDSMIAPLVWIAEVPAGATSEELGLGFDDSDDDAQAQGNMTAFGANAQVEFSSTAADTRSALIVGLDASGDPQSEVVVLNGSTPVLSVGTYSSVYAVKLDSESGSNTVTIKQGSGGTVRGTIGTNVETCWLWLQPTSEGTAMKLGDLASGGSYGFWDRITWPVSTPAARPARSSIAAKEGV